MVRGMRAREAVALLVVASCGGQVSERPDASGGPGGVGAASAVGGGGGVGGTGGVVLDSGSAGYAAAWNEPWDATTDGAPGTAEASCGVAGTPLPDPCTEGEMKYRLSRRWWQCSGQFAFNTADAVGIEFTSDGHWYLLVVDAAGAVVRGSSASHQGTWKTHPSSSPCFVPVDIHQTGTLPSFPIFTTQPATVNLNTGGDGGAPVYVAIP